MEKTISTTFRSAQSDTPAETATPSTVNPTIGQVDTNVEVPFTDYKKMNQKPYLVDYLGLGDLWDDPQGGYEEEVSTIEKYFAERIENGEIPNSISAVKNELKELEKINNLKHEERVSVKSGVLASYVKFLQETNGIHRNVRKYAYR